MPGTTCAQNRRMQASAKLAIASIPGRGTRLARKNEKGRLYFQFTKAFRRDRLSERYLWSFCFYRFRIFTEPQGDRLATLLAERQHDNQSSAYRGKAEELITRDENEKSPFGQGVRKAYPLADLFVRTSSVANLRGSIDRFVHVLFGDVWKTPTRDEEGMAFASIACLRSASPARQVGAAITDDAGRVLGVGTNEVASLEVVSMGR